MKNNTCDILKFKQPALEWIDGLPLGNGAIGAMLYGSPGKEIFTLNHDRLWRNYEENKINNLYQNNISKKSRGYFLQVTKLIICCGFCRTRISSYDLRDVILRVKAFRGIGFEMECGRFQKRNNNDSSYRRESYYYCT